MLDLTIGALVWLPSGYSISVSHSIHKEVLIMATKREKNKAKLERRKPIGHVVPHVNSRRAFLGAADAFLRDDNPELALELLKQIESHGSMSLDVLRLYLDVLHQLQKFDDYARIANLFAEQFPEDPIANLLAGSSSLSAMQPISSILYFERFLKQAPDHPAVPMARKELETLHRHLPEFLDAFLDDLPKELPRVASVEKILHVFKLGRFDDVIMRARRHLKTYPADLRIRNNLAEALALKGDLAESTKIINETLEIAPENFFAIAVRCRLNYFQGHAEDSLADAEKLLALKPRQISDLTKAAQSFAFVGFETGIRWAYEQAKQRNWFDDSSTEAAILTNLYGTCLAFAGDMQSARLHWKHAVKIAGPATTAQDNLDDAKQSAAKRWGPMYFDMRDWLSQTQQKTLRESSELAQLLAELGDEISNCDPYDAISKQLLRMHPEIELLIPGMLNRGDAGCQRLALIVASTSQRPDVRAALLTYVQGARGTDQFRSQILPTLKNMRQAFDSPRSFFVNGKQQQIELIGFEITDEPNIPDERTDETCERLEAANQALRAGEGAKAESLLRQVQKIEPNAPDVLNNLAVALQMQDRMDEANVLVDEVINKHPTYFFGRIAAAGRALNEKDYDQAQTILIELQRRERLQTSEFFALVKISVHFNVAKGAIEPAQRWLDMLKDYAPDHHDIPKLTRLIAGLKGVRGMARKLLEN
jgi:tetratricopeptide (TPR) repeat protein